VKTTASSGKKTDDSKASPSKKPSPVPPPVNNQGSPSDGLCASRGDIIIARRNDRSVTDGNGAYIRNGTTLDVVRIGRRDGSLCAIRRDTGAAITLDRAYVESSVELGYATTAHRSQGITVDTGHTVVTPGRLTRELLYVSMTRGRVGNYAYVSESDPLEHERLSAEYDYLAQIAAAEDLTAFLESHAPRKSRRFPASSIVECGRRSLAQIGIHQPSWRPTASS
jgi:ATP-dependent exoDNAse (exonuclease V) alpha subunit